MFVWYEVWLIFLTSLNDFKLFHLIEFSWQVSCPTKTPSSTRARKMQDTCMSECLGDRLEHSISVNTIEICFHFICEPG